MIILTTLTIYILKLCYPHYDWNGLRKRIFFWWVMHCLFVFALLYTQWFGLMFLASSFILIFMLL